MNKQIREIYESIVWCVIPVILVAICLILDCQSMYAQKTFKVSDFTGGMVESKAIEKYNQNEMVNIENLGFLQTLGRLVARQGFIKDPLFVDSIYYQQRLIKYEVTDTVGNEDARIVIVIGRSNVASASDTATIQFYDIAGNYIDFEGVGNIDADSLHVNEGSITVNNEALRVDFSSSRKTTDDAFDNMWYGVVQQKWLDEDSLNYRMRYKAPQHLINWNIFYLGATIRIAGDAISDSSVYRLTYIYDGYQESTFLIDSAATDDSSKAYSIQVASQFGSNEVGVNLYVDTTHFNLKDTVYNSIDELNKRITAVNFYRARKRVDSLLANEYPIEDFYFLRSISLDDGAWKRTSTVPEWFEYSFVDSLSDADLITQDNYTDRIGHFSSNDKINATLSVFVNSRRFVAGVYKHGGFTTATRDKFGRKYYNRVYYCSLQSNTSPPTYAPDSFGELNFFRIGSDFKPITALAEWQGRLYVFKRDEIYRISITEPIEYSTIELLERGTGSINHRALVITDEGMYFVGQNGIYFNNGYASQKIDYGMTFWKDDSEELLGWYNGVDDEYWIFKNEEVFIYSLLYKAWRKLTIGGVNNIVDVSNTLTDTVYVMGKDGDGAYSILFPSGLMGVDSIYNASNDITFTVESPRYNFGTDFIDKRYDRVAVRFDVGTVNADTTFKFYFYVEGDTVTHRDSAYINITGTGETVKLLNLPQSAVGADFSFKVVSDADSLEFSGMEVIYETRERKQGYQ